MSLEFGARTNPQTSDPTGLAPVTRGFLHYLGFTLNSRVSSAKTREPPTRGTRGRWGRLFEDEWFRDILNATLRASASRFRCVVGEIFERFAAFRRDACLGS